MQITNYPEYIEARRQRLQQYSFDFSLNPNKDFDKLVTKGRLKQAHVDFIKRLIPSLEEVYPNQYDIQYKLSPLFETVENRYGNNHTGSLEVFKKLVITHINIVIHFPEFVIKNSRKEFLTVKDLYVSIPFRVAYSGGGFYESPKMERIEGTRTTVSLAEYKSGYCHSHLQGRNYESQEREYGIGYGSFCTGAGDINAMQSLINAEYDDSTFQLFLLHLKGFVEWESLEGKPYRRLQDIVTKNMTVPETTVQDARSYFYNLRRLVRDKRRKVNVDIDWKFIDNQYVVIDNEKFESFLSSVKEKMEDEGNSSSVWWLYKDETNNYFIQTEYSEEDIGQKSSWIPFRGQKIYFTVEGEIKKAISRNYYLHPKIKSYVKSRLEFYANNAKIRESGVAKLNTSNNS